MTDLLNDSRISRIIQEALSEDIGLGDITTESIVESDISGDAELLVKETGVIAGLGLASLVFQFVDPEITFKKTTNDGAYVQAGTVAGTIAGPLASILKAERTALNFMQRMSGIATLTRQFVGAVAGTRAKITDTRKTAPGMRLLDKLAVKIGGGVNHRFGLDDMVLIKDNHIEAAGGISKAIEKCLNYLNASSIKLKIEVETKNLDEIREALKFSGIHRIMLDNFSINEMTKAVILISGKVEVEASGNVNIYNVLQIAETGVDYISIGALTHSVRSLDISLNVKTRSTSK
ncbi:MAG: carboxylating nicotinate-nucleotide diphosphorylase [Bacteroidota bacterium]|nr:carboxylating nicotinate-nucleotide diphosphorylase [Bacteroidota bacterium]